MSTLTSVLNFGSLIALSCCNAVLQIAAAPACTDPADSQWPSCAPDGSLGEADLRHKVFKPGRVTRVVMERDRDGERLLAAFHGDGKLESAHPGGDNVGREWQLQGDRVCLRFDPGYRSVPECGAFQVQKGTLYLVADEGSRMRVESIAWGTS